MSGGGSRRESREKPVEELHTSVHLPPVLFGQQGHFSSNVPVLGSQKDQRHKSQVLCLKSLCQILSSTGAKEIMC